MGSHRAGLTARALFVAGDGRLHAPWRILLFLILTAAATIVVTIALAPVLAPAGRLTGLREAPGVIALTLGLLLAHGVALRTFDKRPWAEMGLGTRAARPKVLLFGWILGAAPILIISLSLLAVGWLAVEPSTPGPWLTAAIQVSLVLLPASMYEELLSRGYLFATIREWLGPAVAVAATSIGFGLMHVWNPGANALSIVLVILAGVFLAAVLIVTGSLYAAWMAHWAWNWVMAVPLHVAVSGLPLPRPDYQIVDAGPDWITGGQWGPEGGAGAGIGMLSVLAYLYWRRPSRQNADDER